jgi:Homoserine dehydrogenase, NAD binding domain
MTRTDSSSKTDSAKALETVPAPQDRHAIPASRDHRVSKVALLGFGTVGSSVARILCERAPAHLRLTHVCNRNVARKKVDWLSGGVKWTEDINDVLSSDVDIVVEVIGGIQPAKEWISKAPRFPSFMCTSRKTSSSRPSAEGNRVITKFSSDLASTDIPWFDRSRIRAS